MFLNILQIIGVIGTILTGLFSLLAPTKIKGFTGIKPIGGRGITEIRSIFGALFIGLGIAAFLLEQGVDVNSKSKKGFSALMAASAAGKTEIAKLLISKGANVNLLVSNDLADPITGSVPHKSYICNIKKA